MLVWKQMREGWNFILAMVGLRKRMLTALACGLAIAATFLLVGCPGGAPPKMNVVTVTGKAEVPAGTPIASEASLFNKLASLFISRAEAVASRTPFANATVLAFRFGNGQLLGQSITDSGGNYQIPNIPIGADVVIIAQKDNIRLSTILPDPSEQNNVANLNEATTVAAEAFARELYKKERDVISQDFNPVLEVAKRETERLDQLDLTQILPQNFGDGLRVNYERNPEFFSMVASVEALVPKIREVVGEQGKQSALNLQELLRAEDYQVEMSPPLTGNEAEQIWQEISQKENFQILSRKLEEKGYAFNFRESRSFHVKIRRGDLSGDIDIFNLPSVVKQDDGSVAAISVALDRQKPKRSIFMGHLTNVFALQPGEMPKDSKVIINGMPWFFVEVLQVVNIPQGKGVSFSSPPVQELTGGDIKRQIIIIGPGKALIWYRYWWYDSHHHKNWWYGCYYWFWKWYWWNGIPWWWWNWWWAYYHWWHWWSWSTLWP